jgi:enediyne biosynthesis protein E4
MICPSTYAYRIHLTTGTRRALDSEDGEGKDSWGILSNGGVSPVVLPAMLRAFSLFPLPALPILGVAFGHFVRAEPVHFRDVTDAAGLREPLAGFMGHGGAAGDFDNDGRIDLFAGSFSDRRNAEYAPASGPVPNRLMRNLGDGRFALMEGPGGSAFARTSGAVFADLDNDGDLELYIANNAKADAGKESAEPQRSAKTQRSELFRNDGGGKFTDISKESGACPERLLTARNVAVLDYDGDGLLDLFVVEDKFTRSPRSTLLRNLGGLKFKDATREAGLPEDIFGLGSAVADLNEDGRPDFFVGHSNRLFVSKADNGYREATELAALFRHEPFDGEDWPCGAAFGDLNRDGRLDLVVTAHANRARNRVFLNEGPKDGMLRFREITREAGLGDVVPTKCPHVEIEDFDNDGWPDIYLSAAWLEEGHVTPLIFRHDGLRDGLPRFTPPRPIKAPMVYYPAGPSADLNRDGRIDLFLINWFAGNHSRLLQNESASRRWLAVRVTGRKMNGMGIGAQVRVFRAGALGKSDALLGFREISTGHGYASGQPAAAHFGLGDAVTVDVQVRLPDGRVIDRAGVPSDQTLTIEEP